MNATTSNPTLCAASFLGKVPTLQATTIRIPTRPLLIVLAVLALLPSSTALAQTSATWTNGGGDGLWSTGANWSTGSPPGSTTSTTSADSAFFGNVNTITVDSNRNILNIHFTGAGV